MYSPKRPEKTIYRIARLVLGSMEAYFQIVLFLMFGLYTGAWGFIGSLIFWIILNCGRTPVDPITAIFSGIFDCLYMRRFDFVFEGNIQLGYLEEPEEFLHDDYKTMMKENYFKFFKGAVCFGTILYNNPNLRSFEGYNDHFSIAFGIGVICWILVSIKYIHDVLVIQRIRNKVFYFRGVEPEDLEDESHEAIQKWKSQELDKETKANSHDKQKLRDFDAMIGGNNNEQTIQSPLIV